MNYKISRCMDYSYIYYNLIHKAKHRSLDGYKEKHHIVPKCVGGDDNPDNLVELTPEEHYVAHLLLIKIYPKNRLLIHAAVMMTVSGKDHCRNNKLYGWLRRKHSNSVSVNQSGAGNSQFGRYWICNTLTGEVKRINANDSIPAGWIRGKTGFTSCEVCRKNTGSKQRRFCIDHKPKSIAPKSPMAKGSPSALKLSAYCKKRPKEQHPQYGKRWVHKEGTQKMILKADLSRYVVDGWTEGKIPRLS